VTVPFLRIRGGWRGGRGGGGVLGGGGGGWGGGGRLGGAGLWGVVPLKLGGVWGGGGGVAGGGGAGWGGGGGGVRGGGGSSMVPQQNRTSPDVEPKSLKPRRPFPPCIRFNLV